MLLDGTSKHEFLRQRRVFVTPTLFRYSMANEEESNRVIRKFKSFLPNFIRLTFTNEKLEKGYYFNGSSEKNNFILGYIFKIVANGFQLGTLDFKFLSYSNS
jgi:RNA dependent RNA polymerase